MEKLPTYVETWVVKRTQERHYLCRLCGSINDDHGNEEMFRIHLSSWNHRLIIRKMEALFCKSCSIQCKYPSHYNAHIKSKSHIKKETPESKPKIDYRCEVCNIEFGSRKDEIRHLATKKHIKKVTPSDDALFCKACNITCKYPSQYTIHSRTKKHLKNAGER